MKTIMVIDGAENRPHHGFFRSSDVLFHRIFPDPRQSIAFIEDVWAREGEALAGEFSAMWQQPVQQKNVQRIDGVLFCYERLYKDQRSAACGS